jgi:hypothetical protein
MSRTLSKLRSAFSPPVCPGLGYSFDASANGMNRKVIEGISFFPASKCASKEPDSREGKGSVKRVEPATAKPCAPENR